MTQKEEQEANAFAMELLMPKDLFMVEAKKLHEKKFKSEDMLIYRLSIKFQVSEAVITARMINLGILTSI